MTPDPPLDNSSREHVPPPRGTGPQGLPWRRFLGIIAILVGMLLLAWVILMAVGGDDAAAATMREAAREHVALTRADTASVDPLAVGGSDGVVALFEEGCAGPMALAP